MECRGWILLDPCAGVPLLDGGNEKTRTPWVLARMILARGRRVGSRWGFAVRHQRLSNIACIRHRDSGVARSFWPGNPRVQPPRAQPPRGRFSKGRLRVYGCAGVRGAGEHHRGSRCCVACEAGFALGRGRGGGNARGQAFLSPCVIRGESGGRNATGPACRWRTGPVAGRPEDTINRPVLRSAAADPRARHGRARHGRARGNSTGHSHDTGGTRTGGHSSRRIHVRCRSHVRGHAC